jgi:Protein of unknown function (DUF3467)
MSENESEHRIGLDLQADELTNAPRAYANNVRVTFTPEDFTIYFGWYSLPPLDARPEGGEISASVAPVMQVTLPLNLMRSIIAVMQRQLEGYEANFGPIPTHPARPAWMTAGEETEENA